MSTSLLSPELDKYIASLRREVAGARAVVLADRDGVVLALDVEEELSSNLEDLLESMQVASAASAAEQVGKVGQGRGSIVVAVRGEGVLVHLPLLPLIVTVLGNDHLNLGLLTSLRPSLTAALEPLRVAAQSLEAEMGA